MPSSTRHVTHPLPREIDVLARSKVAEYACACNSDAIVQPVTLLETLGDLPLHNLADASSVLLRARHQQQSQQQHSSTHHANLHHAAVALQALSNRTTAFIRQLFVVPLHHTPSHEPPAPHPSLTPALQACIHHVTSPSPLTCPCLPSRSS